MAKLGFCIFVDAVAEGPVPLERDAEGNIIVYSTEEEAERVIVEDVIERCRQFLDGERPFWDAICVEEYVIGAGALEVYCKGDKWIVWPSPSQA